MMYLPAEIATGISTQWMTYMSMKPESQASAVSGGDAETKDVPRMPCRDEPQLPGPPSEPIGALIAAIGAVAKLLTTAEIKEDSEAQLAMDTEFYFVQASRGWHDRDVGLVPGASEERCHARGAK